VSLHRNAAFLAFSLLFSLLFTVSSYGGVHSQPVSAEELKMTSEPLAPGAPAIILYREVNRDDYGISNRGGMRIVGNESAAPASRYEEDYYRIKILTEEGRKYADIEIPYDSWAGKINGIMARTIHPDGSIVNFSGQVMDKTLVRGRGVQWRAKTLAMPDVQAGSIIEYFYTINFHEGYFFSSNWILNDRLFTKAAKFSLKPNHDDYNPISFRWMEHLPAGTPSPKQNPDNSVHLDVTNIAAFQPEDFMPPQDELKARVDFIYSYDPFENDPVKFWKKVGKKRNDALEGFVSKRGPIDAAVGQTVSPGDTPEAKLRKLYARVQQLSNRSYQARNIELAKRHELLNRDDIGDKAEEKKKKVAETAEEIWKQGAGDSRQLNWLYLAMVRAAGIEAYGVLISERRNFFFNPMAMESEQLNGTAVLVKLDGKDLYLSPGSAYAPFGMLPWERTGVAGLRLDRDGGTWIKTNLPDSTSSKISRKADLKLSADGSLTGKLEVSFTGLEAITRREEETNHDDLARKASLEQQVESWIPVGSEITLTNQPDWTGSETPLIATFDVKVPGWASAAGNRALVPIGLFGAPEKHTFEYSSRTYPIYFDFPSEKADDINIELPPSWQVSSTPKPQSHDLHAVGCTMSAESSKTGLHLTRKINVSVLEIDPKYYTALRSFYQGVKAADEQPAVLVAGSVTPGN
jgi:hypothetical protein